MLSDFLELSFYPLLLFTIPFVAVAIILGVNDYMDSKEEKLKKNKITNNKNMSYYCKGIVCHRKDECLMHLSWKDYVDTFKKPDVKEGFETGIWFIPENTCIKNNFEDGVFKTD